MEVTYIARNKIKKNENNGFAKKKIEELAQDIKTGGLEQPLVVYKLEDGNYKLLTGERRLTAIDQLIEKGDWITDIPVIIKDLNEYDLPLPLELKESYAILRTNAFTRGKLDDEDKFFAATQYAKIIKELRKQGYNEMFMGFDGDGNEVKEDITGRVRDVVHRLTDISNGQISKIEKIESQGTDALKKAVKSEKININNAEKLASLPAEKQEKVLEENEKVTPEVVRSAMEEEKLSAYGTKLRVYPEDSLIKTLGCEGGHDCFACHLQCDIRKKFCYCVEAPMGNPFPCTVLDKVSMIKKEVGDRCQFVNLESAYHRTGDNEPEPCCKNCKEPCKYACERAVNQKAEQKQDIAEQEHPLSYYVQQYCEKREDNKKQFLKICNENDNNTDRAKKIQQYIASFGYHGESFTKCTFMGYQKGIYFEDSGKKVHMTYIQFVKFLEELYGPWAMKNDKKEQDKNVREEEVKKEPENSSETNPVSEGIEADQNAFDSEKQKQPELPILKNNDQRKEWLEDYKAWGLWYRDENIDVNYYKYDFPDGSRLIVAEYPHREMYWIKERRDEFFYHFLEKNKSKYGGKGTYDEVYRNTTNSTTELIEYLKKIQKNGAGKGKKK